MKQHVCVVCTTDFMYIQHGLPLKRKKQALKFQKAEINSTLTITNTGILKIRQTNTNSLQQQQETATITTEPKVQYVTLEHIKNNSRIFLM